ncbi:MAG: CHAP domain-containing protein [Sphingomonadales bacterium]|nr:CHAP domain-containing protein [Sphingomonadales bacterium]MDE2570596.1 CHAP domain-containing protein [Sphingomonadales bacterium]
MKAISCTLAVSLVLGATPAIAVPIAPSVIDGPDDSDGSQPILQCVPYARQVSGIQIYGDAWTWWDQAAGRYARGETPRVGAVMSFKPYGAMQLGHVAAVSKVVDSRTVLLRHANWSPIDGKRGQIEDDVRAVDVSPDNDWSEVRVWFAPINGLGTTHWPLNGFIYPQKAKPGLADTARLADAGSRWSRVEPQRASLIGKDFLKGITPEVPMQGTQEPRSPTSPAVRPSQVRYPHTRDVQPAPRRVASNVPRGSDPIGRLISGLSQ